MLASCIIHLVLFLLLADGWCFWSLFAVIGLGLVLPVGASTKIGLRFAALWGRNVSNVFFRLGVCTCTRQGVWSAAAGLADIKVQLLG
jgi:hypothetical protein